MSKFQVYTDKAYYKIPSKKYSERDFMFISMTSNEDFFLEFSYIIKLSPITN